MADRSAAHAEVEVVNQASGYSVTTTTRRGQFAARGFEVGGPYVVTVRRLGFAPGIRDGVYLALGEPRSLDFVLEFAARVMSGVRVVEHEEPMSRTHGGTVTTISDSLLHRLP